MTFSESKEFSVHSSSLKEIRNFARVILAKDDILNHQVMMSFWH